MKFEEMKAMEKIKVGILGATGSVGQRFVELLEDHPLFEVSALCASDRSAGKKYGELMKSRWKISSDIPNYARQIVVTTPEPDKAKGVQIVFSGLDASIAGEVETEFAKAGVFVISNSKNHRGDPDVPILSAEVNAEHLSVLEFQNTKGKIITNSNCTIMGVTIALKPLMDAYGIESLILFSMQAISGAGYPGVPTMDILGNVIPFIGGEEPKAEFEPLKCLGRVVAGKIEPAEFKISAHCNRVPVFDGHTVAISIKLKKKVTKDEIIAVWRNFQAEPQKLHLPSAPSQPIVYREEEDRPQPRLDLNEGKGMSVVLGRLREDPILDWKFVVLSHNTVRGAAGAAVLNAELLVKKGYLSTK